jgi:pimeloyl-ACP methyl ester carboxylesterase
MTALSRRNFLVAGLGCVVTIAAAGGVGYALVEEGILPGKYRLEVLLGGCDVSHPPLEYGPPGETITGTFFSHYRNTEVGYTIAYPSGFSHLTIGTCPLVLVLHGEGGTHKDALWPQTMSQAASLKANGKLPRPMALVSMDGGRGYWNQHPGDDPFGMLIHEIIPMCRKRGLATNGYEIGAMGISMGGYGALLLGEKRPDLIRAVAAISPAAWTSYDEATSVNPQAYTSAQAFASADVFTHTDGLKDVPVRVAVGQDDPFRPNVQKLIELLPRSAITVVSAGCHTAPFFTEQLPLSLGFLGRHLFGQEY